MVTSRFPRAVGMKNLLRLSAGTGGATLLSPRPSYHPVPEPPAEFAAWRRARSVALGEAAEPSVNLGLYPHGLSFPYRDPGSPGRRERIDRTECT